MFGISIEHFVIVGIILIVLGPKRLPEMGNSVGKAIKNFKDSLGGLHDEEKKLAEKTAAEKPVLDREATAKIEAPSATGLSSSIASSADDLLKNANSTSDPAKNIKKES